MRVICGVKFVRFCKLASFADLLVRRYCGVQFAGSAVGGRVGAEVVQRVSVVSHRHASGEGKRFWYLETREASNGTGNGEEAVAVDPQLAAQRQARRALEA